VTSRTYLSIGDVLTLLREEFPDITISKIRFLESQGLVNPERSPSGYRKFFDTDVERLRWVLRQQREHFLPLKVIRDRLADGDLSEGGVEPATAAASAGPATRANGRSSERAHAVAGAAHAERGHASGLGTGTGTATAPRTAEQSTQADDAAMARILADASRRVARVPDSMGEHALLEAVPDPGAPPPPGHSDVLDVPRERDLPHTPEVAGLRADPDAPAIEPELADSAKATSASAAGGGAPTSTPAPAGGPEPGSAPTPEAVSPEATVTDEAPAPSAALEPTAEAAPESAPESAAESAAAAAAASVPAPAHSSNDVFSRAAAAAGAPSEAVGAPGGVVRQATGGETGMSRGPGDGRAASPEISAAVARAERARQSNATERGGAAADKRAATGGAGSAAEAPGAGKSAASTGKGSGSMSQRAGASGGGGAAGAAGAAGDSSSLSTSGMVTGASLTTEELCAASGLSEIELAGLQGFGLIEPVMVAGIPTFDEDALTVANLAAEFRKFGIEARHLRPYRNAVDREMGLIEQVIIPLLRQRNPESRQRAVDAADELGALGQTMRASLLRTAMRRHLGG
jgi:DNA-binding transcriptional MerR regulator